MTSSLVPITPEMKRASVDVRHISSVKPRRWIIGRLERLVSNPSLYATTAGGEAGAAGGGGGSFRKAEPLESADPSAEQVARR